MIVVGVDPGSVRTGYGIVKDEKGTFSLIDCGVIRLSSRQSLPERIKIIYDELGKLIAVNKPARLALETGYVNRNAQSALKLGQVRGAVVALAMNRKVELHEYAPREVKQVLTGRGGASKEQVAYMARYFLNIDNPIKPFDVSDALGIALCDLLCKSSPVSVGNGKTEPAMRRNNWSEFVKANPDLVI